jgi:hypothetical protein
LVPAQGYAEQLWIAIDPGCRDGCLAAWAAGELVAGGRPEVSRCGFVPMVIRLTLLEYLFDSGGVGAEVAHVIGLAPMRHRDDVLAGEGMLPVLPALRELLPGGGLQRGSVVASGNFGLLSLALVAGAVADGAWGAVVGVPDVGMRAAAEAGVDPDRVLLVAEPGSRWPQVVASLLDGFDVVLLQPPDQPSAQLRRKLEAAARRYGSVLVVAGDWPGAQSRLLVTHAEWAGIGAGHGRLRARRAQVVVTGRGAGEQPRSAWLWLPGTDGTVTAAARGLTVGELAEGPGLVRLASSG